VVCDSAATTPSDSAILHSRKDSCKLYAKTLSVSHIIKRQFTTWNLTFQAIRDRSS